MKRAALVALLGGLMAPFLVGETTRPAVPPHATAAQLSSNLLQEMNRIRAAHHLPPFAGLKPLDAAAEDQATLCALRMRAAHDNPMRGHGTAGDRVRFQGVDAAACAENVAAVAVGDGETIDAAGEIVRKLIEGWMNSPGHRANLLDETMTHAGAAIRIERGPQHIWYAYGVQVFARLAPPFQAAF